MKNIAANQILRGINLWELKSAIWAILYIKFVKNHFHVKLVKLEKKFREFPHCVIWRIFREIINLPILVISIELPL